MRRFPDMRPGAPCESGCTGVHSYTADGTRWCWAGAQRGRQALDAELITREPPEQIARLAREGRDVWQAWTAMEVLAKLTDTPVVAMLQHHGLQVPDDPRFTLTHHQFGDTLCCMGERRD